MLIAEESPDKLAGAYGAVDQTATLLSPIDVEVTIPSQRTWQGQVVELTPTDLRARFDSEIPLGEILQMTCRSKSYRFETSMLALLHWSHHDSNGWEAGFFLDQALPPNVIANCWMDMRKEIRYPGNWLVDVRLEADAPSEPGIVRNYARSGFLLEAGRGAEPNQLIEVESEAANLNSLVRWSKIVDRGRYLLGCEMSEGLGIRLATHLRTADPLSFIRSVS